MSFGETLVKKNIVSTDLLVRSKREANSKNISLEEVLIGSGVSEDAITQAKSEAFNIPVKKVTSSVHIPLEILKQIPEESAKHYKFVPLALEDGVVHMGIVNPDDMEAREALQFLSSKLNLPFKIFLISLSDLEFVLEDYRSLGGETAKILDELESVIGQNLVLENAESPRIRKEDAPVTKMVAVILKHAIEGKASDVHIEPQRDRLNVRFRVDGILHTSLTLPLKVHEAIVSRIKILTNMKLDEKRKPQDGRFGAPALGQQVDFRVSTFPTFFGEKVVIRVLSSAESLNTLEKLGLLGRNLELTKNALKKPYGLILVTGPTGSGKTSTLYSMINMLDKEKFNVVSLEDPVEYNIAGVSQSQVRPEIDYDFASGLRSVLRQDPDIIMVGEIRDNETAALAIRAALTGHLVFSTLHTNNSISAIPRLLDMGIEPFLLPSTLILVVAQRLVRTLCEESRKPFRLEGAMKEIIEKELKDAPPFIKTKINMPKEIYQSFPSSSCPRGVRGRTGIFEVFQMTPELEKIILTNAGESDIMKEVRNQGMLTMREDGILKVLEGKTGLEELKESVQTK
ncbi:GspE/PulE family protein [Patescibacteria group bacterium]|nr:GspE/PulE family protein [Patescibacteria group bacterium]